MEFETLEAWNLVVGIILLVVANATKENVPLFVFLLLVAGANILAALT
jgi:F0F1-type ATP synthase assembly protein I